MPLPRAVLRGPRPEGRACVQQRFMLIREVVDPMRWEATQIADAARGWPRRYGYAAQPFAVQLKEFWPLHRLARVQTHFVPTLLHENDGLILQVRRPQQIAPCAGVVLPCAVVTTQKQTFEFARACRATRRSTARRRAQTS